MFFVTVAHVLRTVTEHFPTDNPVAFCPRPHFMPNFTRPHSLNILVTLVIIYKISQTKEIS